MKIHEASGFFKSLLTGTDRKSEIRVYEEFIGILSELKNRDLTEKQLELIEKGIDILSLEENHENNKKYYTRKLTEFKKYLNDQLSLITEGYYTGIGMIYGIIFGPGIGLVFGVIFGKGVGIGIGLSIGAGIGMVVGMIFGAAKDSEAKKLGRVLKTKSD